MRTCILTTVAAALVVAALALAPAPARAQVVVYGGYPAYYSTPYTYSYYGPTYPAYPAYSYAPAYSYSYAPAYSYSPPYVWNSRYYASPYGSGFYSQRYYPLSNRYYYRYGNYPW
jgi:hypothetical protein